MGKSKVPKCPFCNEGVLSHEDGSLGGGFWNEWYSCGSSMEFVDESPYEYALLCTRGLTSAHTAGFIWYDNDTNKCIRVNKLQVDVCYKMKQRKTKSKPKGTK